MLEEFEEILQNDLHGEYMRKQEKLKKIDDRIELRKRKQEEKLKEKMTKQQARMHRERDRMAQAREEIDRELELERRQRQRQFELQHPEYTTTEQGRYMDLKRERAEGEARRVEEKTTRQQREDEARVNFRNNGFSPSKYPVPSQSPDQLGAPSMHNKSNSMWDAERYW